MIRKLVSLADDIFISLYAIKTGIEHMIYTQSWDAAIT